MKKLILSLIAAGALAAGITASAEVGDVVGNVYSTDILATVNGYAVPSYSLDGKTAIALRDLENYDFHVYYDDYARIALVNFTLNAEEDVTPIEGVERGTVGEVVGEVLETDITAYINGAYVQTYNIGGTLVAAIEDIAPWNDGSEFAAYGYAKTGLTYTWDEESRTVNLITLPKSNQFIAQNMAMENLLTLNLSAGYLTAEESRFSDLYLRPGSWTGITGYTASGNQIYPIKYAYPDGHEEEIGLFYGFYAVNWDAGGANVRNSEYFNNTGMYFDMDKLEEIIAMNKPEPRTFEEELEFWRGGGTGIWRIRAEMETDEYVVLDMIQSGLPHGGAAYRIMRLDKNPLNRQILSTDIISVPELYDPDNSGEHDKLYYFKGTSLYKMNVLTGEETEVCAATTENVLAYLKEYWNVIYEYSDEYTINLLLERDGDYRVYRINEYGVIIDHRGSVEEAYVYNGDILVKSNGQWSPDRMSSSADTMVQNGERIV